MKAPTKPLSRMKNTSKGSIHHMEIHPAKNSKGKQAFITKTVRNPAQPSTLGAYMPPPDPEETPHEDGQDMLEHVGHTFGIKPEDDGDSDED